MGEEQGLSAENRALSERVFGTDWTALAIDWRFLNRLLDAARAEGLQPPVGVVEEVFSSLGASKAPSSASAGVAETPSGGWIPSTGVNPAPGAHVDVRFRNGDVCRSARSEAWDWALEPTGGCIVVVWRLARGSPTDCQTSGGEA